MEAPSRKKIQMKAVRDIKDCPPGYHFNPTDEVLVGCYLEPKIKNEPIPISGICDVNLYGPDNPETLAERYPPLEKDEWYFFTPRERKYRNGSRPNRAAGTGYWKATEADKSIRSGDKIIGFKKSLVFCEGKYPDGVRTSWMMHEFTVDQPRRNKRNANDMRLDDWVLCRIYKKAARSKTNQQEDEGSDSVDHEEVDTPIAGNNVNLPLVEHYNGPINNFGLDGYDLTGVDDIPIASNDDDNPAHLMDDVATIKHSDGLLNIFDFDNSDLQTSFDCGVSNQFLNEQLSWDFQQGGFQQSSCSSENLGTSDQFSSYFDSSTLVDVEDFFEDACFQ